MSLNHVKAYNQEIRAWILKVFEVAAAIPKGQLVKRPCPVCGAAQSDFFANNDFLDYHRCSRCSLIFMNPAPPPEMVARGFQGEDELLADYFAIVEKFRRPPTARPDPLSDGKLRDIYALKPSGSLLDVGCSFGDFLHKAKHFYDAEGLEINPYTAQVAGRDFTVHRDFLSKLDLEKRYDIVTLHQILYGVPDTVELLREIHKVLARDGILYVNTPNADSYAMRTYRGKANHLYGYTTLNVFGRKSLEALAARTGFKILSFRTEWLDIYLADLTEFHDHPDRFIHKRNCHLPGYEEKIAQEDALHAALYPDLGEGGNYLVAVLGKDVPS